MPYCPCGEIVSASKTCSTCDPAANAHDAVRDAAADLRGLQVTDASTAEVLVRELASNIEKSEWHYSEGEDTTYGPVGIQMMRDLFVTGMIDTDACVWTEAMGEGADWLSLSDPKNASVLALLKGPTAATAGAGTRAPGTADSCAGCGGVLDSAERNVFGALGKLWHSGCFRCSGCNQPIANGSFTPHDGKAYHKACHLKQFGTRCAGCDQPIDGGCLVVENKKYHTQCFTCAECGGSLKDGYALGPVSGRPFCTQHAKAAKAREAGSAAPALSAAVARVVDKEVAAAMADAACGRRRSGVGGRGDRLMVDGRTGQEVYVELEMGSKYQLDAAGNKVYQKVKEQPRYGGGTTWRTDGGATK